MKITKMLCSIDLNRIPNKDHKIRKYKINKISLSSYDDKKFILGGGCSMLSCLHKSTC